MTSDEAFREFSELDATVLSIQEIDAIERTDKLKHYIDALLRKNDAGRDRRILEGNIRTDIRPNDCRLYVFADSFQHVLTLPSILPISYRNNVGAPCIIRNFKISKEPSIDLKLAEALLATMATPPDFTAMSIIRPRTTKEYIDGGFVDGNPLRRMISELDEAFRPDKEVACVLSLGCGYAGIFSVQEGSKIPDWRKLWERNKEDTAESVKQELGHLGIYRRFSVSKGLESVSSGGSFPNLGEIITHTDVYLSEGSTPREIDECVGSLKSREPAVPLHRLSMY